MSANTNTVKNWIGGFLSITAMIGFLSLAGFVAIREIPVSNKDFFNMCLVAIIGFCGTAFGYYLGSSTSSARKTELSAMAAAQPPAPQEKNDSQAGWTAMPIMALLLALFLVPAAGLYGCAQQQSAVQQISARTSDPDTINFAAFADAQESYISAQELYLPYQAALKRSRPELNAEIIALFRKADEILRDWEQHGSLPMGDKEAFRAYLREISLKAAMAAEKK
ncbi:MAG: hypothetical protein M0036_05020 [Desulfobacteraceae bacterium]|nr:hypothetical protein [Desulfobacteraceae bacterium]